MNESGIRPVGHRVLVLPEEVEETTASGIVIAKQTTDKERIAQIFATVIEVGEGSYVDTAGEVWAKEGDKVVIGKFAGIPLKGKDQVEYRIISDLDVVARIEF